MGYSLLGGWTAIYGSWWEYGHALSQVKFKGRKIIIPYNGKRYVIVRCKNDNEKDVQEMLQFYHLV